MRRFSVFNSVTLDGYFTDAKGNIDWAHEGEEDREFAAFTARKAQGGGALVMGRRTYEMMKAFWPTDEAKKTMPEVAEGMNRMEKIVFSRTLSKTDWQNTRFVNGDPVATLRKLKQEQGPDMAMMGSGSLVAPLAAAGLIDSYEVVVCPIVLGAGRTMFDGVGKPLRLKQKESRAFGNGKIYIRYEPA
jgi:dihydrofolate reductase